MSDSTAESRVKAQAGRPVTRRRSSARLLILGGLGLILLWLALTAFGIARPLARLRAHQTAAEAIMDQGWRQANPAGVERLILAARDDIDALDRAARPLTAIGPALSWVPKAGPLLADSRALLDMAVSGSDAAVMALPAVKPALALLQSEGDGAMEKLPQLIALLDGAEADLQRASLAFDQVVQARGRLANEQTWPFTARQMLDRLDANLSLARDGLKLATILPALAGHDAPRAYLLMAQNEDELRPSGGFLSGAGYLVVDGGRIVSLDFMDANLVDDWQHRPYDFPPQPYTDFMGMDIFLFRDANFWPDFPASAEQAMALYSYGRDLPLEGAIAIDQRFLEMLLAGTGDVYVQEFETEVGAANVVAQMRQQWGVREDGENWLLERKSFMGPLARAILQRLQSDLDRLDMVHLARNLQAAAEQRHLQIYVRDAAEQAVLAQTDWSGRQVNEAGQDFLLVVDTSMGFNKVNPMITRTIEYKVVLAASGQATAELAVRYENGSPPATEPCTHGTPYTGETQYDDLLHDCYWNYLRVYLPSGARFLDGSRHALAAADLISGRAWDGETRASADAVSGLALLENFILVPAAGEVVFNARYELPAEVIAEEDGRLIYRLRVNKQAGLSAQPLRISLTVPDGREIVATAPAAAQLAAQAALFELPGLTDEVVTVEFR